MPRNNHIISALRVRGFTHRNKSATVDRSFESWCIYWIGFSRQKWINIKMIRKKWEWEMNGKKFFFLIKQRRIEWEWNGSLTLTFFETGRKIQLIMFFFYCRFNFTSVFMSFRYFIDKICYERLNGGPVDTMHNTITQWYFVASISTESFDLKLIRSRWS